jgi:hypothetical protein
VTFPREYHAVSDCSSPKVWERMCTSDRRGGARQPSNYWCASVSSHWICWSYFPFRLIFLGQYAAAFEVVMWQSSTRIRDVDIGYLFRCDDSARNNYAGFPSIMEVTREMRHEGRADTSETILSGLNTVVVVAYRDTSDGLLKSSGGECYFWMLGWTLTK